MFRPKLIAITDTALGGAAHVAARWRAIADAAQPYTVAVQLREHGQSGRLRYELGRSLQQVCEQSSQLLIVNDRLDLGFALNAFGIHLGQASVRPGEVRRLAVELGREAPWISCAVHDATQAAALGEGPSAADAWIVSPVASARKGRAALGFAALARWRKLAPTSTLIYALGGIDASNAATCLENGADGVSVVSAAFAADADFGSLLSALGIAR